MKWPSNAHVVYSVHCTRTHTHTIRMAPHCMTEIEFEN